MSVYLFFIVEKYRFPGKQKKVIVVFAIIIPCILSAFRDNTIGTDTLVYAKPLFDRAVISDSFNDYYNGVVYNYSTTWFHSDVSRFEIGYSLMVYIIAKTTRFFPVLLFVTQLIIDCFFYFGMEKSKLPNKWIGMFVFYFMMFNRTLNLMRQSIAISIIIFAFHYLQNKEYRKFLLFVFISSLFHTSGLLCLLIFMIYYVIFEIKVKHRRLRIVLITIISIVFLFMLKYISIVLENTGLGHYKSYINGNIRIVPGQILLRLPIIIEFYVFLRRSPQIDNNKADFYYLIILFDLLSSQLSSVGNASGRVGLFFSSFIIFIIVEIINLNMLKENKMIIKTLNFVYILLYWYYQYVYMGYNGTVPYQLCV